MINRGDSDETALSADDAARFWSKVARLLTVEREG